MYNLKSWQVRQMSLNYNTEHDNLVIGKLLRTKFYTGRNVILSFLVLVISIAPVNNTKFQRSRNGQLWTRRFSMASPGGAPAPDCPGLRRHHRLDPTSRQNRSSEPCQPAKEDSGKPSKFLHGSLD